MYIGKRKKIGTSDCNSSKSGSYPFKPELRITINLEKVLLLFTGMLASAAVAGRASLPANSMACPVSRVSVLIRHLPGSILYPQILVFSLSRTLSVYTSVVIPVGMC